MTQSIRGTVDYPSLGSFVTDFIAVIYDCQVSDVPAVATWCPQWWKHNAAVQRLSLLWRMYDPTWTSEQISTWLLDHVDRHMAYLVDPRGPFTFCGVHKGHRELLKPLPTDIDNAPSFLFEVDQDRLSLVPRRIGAA